MIKISQLPVAVKATGDEVLPIVQQAETRKAKALFVGPDNKIVIPKDSELTTILNGEEIPLLSASIIDGRYVIQVGSQNSVIKTGENILVTEKIKTDGKSYVRINNTWVERSPITKLNDKIPLTGGGSISVLAKDVYAHEENRNRDGLPYVSIDGTWSRLEQSQEEILERKADKVHSHSIEDVQLLKSSLDSMDLRINSYLHVPAFSSSHIEHFTTTADTGMMSFVTDTTLDINKSPDSLTFSKAGNYIVSISGNTTGTLTLVINGIDTDFRMSGSFNRQKIFNIQKDSVLKIKFDSVGGVRTSLDMVIHKL